MERILDRLSASDMPLRGPIVIFIFVHADSSELGWIQPKVASCTPLPSQCRGLKRDPVSLFLATIVYRISCIGTSRLRRVGKSKEWGFNLLLLLVNHVVDTQSFISHSQPPSASTMPENSWTDEEDLELINAFERSQSEAKRSIGAIDEIPPDPCTPRSVVIPTLTPLICSPGNTCLTCSAAEGRNRRAKHATERSLRRVRRPQVDRRRRQKRRRTSSPDAWNCDARKN